MNFMTLLLNASETVQLSQTDANLNILDLAIKGGWIMIVLAILSVIGIYKFFERLIALRMAIKKSPMLIERIKDNLKEGDIKSAYNYCEKLNTPVSRVLAKGVKDYRFDNASIRQALDNYAGLEIARLEKGLPVISTISAVAPMLGFLGTVTGMVEAFWQMSHAGNDIQVSALSGGIYEAMVTTVGGLVVGIIAIFAYNYLVSRVDKVQNMMEAQIIAFLEVVVECKEDIDPLKEFAQNADNEEYVAQRMEQPVTEPETQPIAKPAAKPVASPAAQPVAKPAAQPAAQPVAKPAAKPVAKTAAAPVSKVDVTESDMNA